MAEVAAVAGFLGLLGPAIELWKCINEPMKRQVIYLCCFKTNVQNLRNEAEQLNNARVEVQSMVDAAQNNAETVFSHVHNWLDKVSKILTKKSEIDKEIDDTTSNGGRCTVGCRYPLSKKVTKMAEEMKKLRLRRESGNVTTNANPGVSTTVVNPGVSTTIANPGVSMTVAHRPPPAAMASINIRSYFEFVSRKRVEEEVMASLRDEKTCMVGICGMGGVGKTTMANTIRHRARNELGFQETVMVAVSQDVNKSNIQDEIADSLGLKFDVKSIPSKAHLLRLRLSPGTRKTLIVIDDVWAKLDLVGIPCSNTCKVLITSRNIHTLEAMEVDKPHAVQILSNEEPWELFKSKAGDCIEKENVVDFARQVVNECNGLPLALVTVGVALKNKDITDLWDNALEQLRSANPIQVPGVIEDVYKPLKLSYDFLEDDHQKSLFLMCCLFPEDSNIPLLTLANIYKGLLHMNKDIKSSRVATRDMVERLKDRFLLLEGKDENHVKMHDVVRDVAIFIAGQERRIKCDERTWISPNIGEIIGDDEGSTHFPNLHLLLIDSESRYKKLEINNDFSDGMRELKVIMITFRSTQRLPESIGLLKNLRTLVLENCESLESISVVGELVNLEILVCRECEKIESLPVEIGGLSRLMLLELGCWYLKRIAPGIISNLRKLEELIVEYFDGWEAMTVKGERKNAPLCELANLSKLTRLKIKIRDYGLAAENFNLPPSLLKFHIIIGGYTNNRNYFSRDKNIMELELTRDISWGYWIHECVRSVEYMYIISGYGSSVLDLHLAQNLRHLIIKNYSTVKKLVTHCPLLELLSLEQVSELEEIRLGNQHNLASNFINLSSIIIKGCGGLRTLFSLSMMDSGDCFLQLEWLKISNCDVMEQVLMWNEEEQNQTNIHIPLLIFPKLKHIQLRDLPRLTSFIKGIQGIEFPQLVEIDIEKCPLLEEFVRSGPPADDHSGDDNDTLHFSCDHPHKVKFGKLSKLQLSEGRNLCLQAPTDSFTSLTRLTVYGLKDLKSLFSFSMNESSCLSQLEELMISKCDMIEQVILWKEEEENQTDFHRVTLFPKLKDLSLVNLPRLTSLTKGIENILFHVPRELLINNCPILESCASEIADENDDDDTHLLCNPHHKINSSKSKIKVEFDEQRISGPSQIPMLEFFRGVYKLHVSKLKGMGSLFPCLIAQMMHNIKELSITECKEMVIVIEDKVDAYETTPPILLFPHLEHLYFRELSILRSFCEWRCGLELPSLLKLDIVECDVMKELTLGPLCTPNLEIINHKFKGKEKSSPLQLSNLLKKPEKVGSRSETTELTVVSKKTEEAIKSGKLAQILKSIAKEIKKR